MTYKLINASGKVIAQMDLPTAYRMFHKELELSDDFLPDEWKEREEMRRLLEKQGVDWRMIG